MTNHQPLILFLIITLGSFFCNASDLYREFYRADARTPEAIKASQGFRPRSETTIGVATPDTSLWNHVRGDGFWSADNDGYVSTTSSFNKAIEIASRDPGTMYVYKIHAGPNLIDCKATMEYYYPHPDEREFAALGGIPFDQIYSWVPVTAGKQGKEKKNSKFSSKKYNKKTKHGGAQYQLAGFPSDHPAWKEHPWFAYADCSKTKRGRNLMQRATCRPKKTSVEFANQYLSNISEYLKEDGQ